MTHKRRFKGFDYGARTPATEEVPTVAPPDDEEDKGPSLDPESAEEAPDANRGPEAGEELGGEGEGRGEGEESPQDESAGEVEPGSGGGR